MDCIFFKSDSLKVKLRYYILILTFNLFKLQLLSYTMYNIKPKIES